MQINKDEVTMTRCSSTTSSNMSSRSSSISNNSSRSNSSSSSRSNNSSRSVSVNESISRVNLEHDRQRVAAWRQTRLNDIILQETRKTCVAREDHRRMLRILISAAYFADKHRRVHLPRWKRILLAVEKEYLGANALLTLAPDPYSRVLATLSSMMLWSDGARHWEYEYCTEEISSRRGRQVEVLRQLKRSGKLFFSQ